MATFNDLSGQTYSNFKVLLRAPNNGNRVAWYCLCACGNTHVVESRNLVNGSVQSCGCLSNHLRSVNSPTKNGNPDNPAYKPWAMMKQR